MPYRTLNAENIVSTLETLKLRIDERFPGRGIGRVADELLHVARATKARVAAINHPYIWMRAGVFGLIAAALIAQVFIIRAIKVPSVQNQDVLDFFQGTDAILNTLVLAGAGVFFLMTLEERVKRSKILEELHVLRSIVHVIDMHQLTKDPIAIFNPDLRTKSSPLRGDMTAFELNRYLDYLTEMLSLTGKLAALYAQNMRDPVVINAVNDIENLATGLSRKIWQKIMLIRRENEAGGGSAKPAYAPTPFEAG